MAEKFTRQPLNGYHYAPDDIIEQPFSGDAQHLYWYLCRRANADGWCWPKTSTICRDIKRSRSSVFSALRELEDAGWVNRDSGQPTGTANRYQILHILTKPRAKGVPHTDGGVLSSDGRRPTYGRLTRKDPLKEIGASLEEDKNRESVGEAEHQRILEMINRSPIRRKANA